MTVGAAGTGHDVIFYGDTSGKHAIWDQSEMELGLLGASKLSFHDVGGGENIVASADGHLEINAGTTLDITAPNVDINVPITSAGGSKLNVDGLIQSSGITVGASGVTIGTGTQQDAKLVFDGNAQDFYIGLDDTDDDLKIGLGSAVGTTPVIKMTGAGAVNFGAAADGYDVTMYGATSGSYFRWDESADGVRLVASNFVQEQVPASNAGTTVSDDSGATINIDWSRGNYHWIVLAADVTKIIFQNMKRGGRYILRIQQHGSSAKTVAWTNVDYNESNGAFTEVRWVGGTAPTMSTGTGRVDVYGFLCTRSNGRGTDGFVIAQNLAEDGTH
jgi:hypothetical protein